MKKNILILSLLTSVILISGCIQNPEEIAKVNPVVKDFLADYPNAEVKITHFTKTQAQNIIESIREDCNNPYLEAKNYYKITIEDKESGLSVLTWIDWENKIVECATKKGKEDTTPPVITIGEPTEGSTIKTDSVWVKATTNENAICKSRLTISGEGGAGQTNWQQMSTTSSTSHSQLIENLKDKHNYKVELNCTDNFDNSAIASVSFYVNLTWIDCSTHSIEITKVEDKNGKISVSYESIDVADNVEVKLSIGTGQGRGQINCPIISGGCGAVPVGPVSCTVDTNCSYPTFELGYRYFVKVVDKDCENVSDTYEIIKDTTPPIVTITSPTDGSVITTDSVWLQVITDENSVCKSRLTVYTGTGGGQTNWKEMDTTGGTSHSQLLQSLNDGNQYTVDVNCTDDSDNTGSDSIQFTVELEEEDTTPPTITITQPEDGSTVITSSITLKATTNENAICNSRLTVFTGGGGGQTNWKQMDNTGGTQHSQSLTNLCDGCQYTVELNCTDDSGNSDIKSITFTKESILGNCEDLDGGKNYNEKGLTKGDAPQGDYYEAEDSCITHQLQQRELVEHYCDENNYHTFETYKCPNGCENGACLTSDTQNCTDTDDGIVYDQKGVCTACENGDCEIVEDVCISNTEMNECYCDKFEIKNVWRGCSGECQNGACVE